jgi:hypothetical protein
MEEERGLLRIITVALKKRKAAGILVKEAKISDNNSYTIDEGYWTGV